MVNRTSTFSISWHPETILTTSPRMVAAFHAALIPRVGEVADKIIRTAQGKLVPGHGYDTGLMHDTLTKVFMQMITDGVFYQLGSTEAYYWAFVEWGHYTVAGNWWEGYHYFEEAIEEHEEDLHRAAEQAWSEAVVMGGVHR